MRAATLLFVALVAAGPRSGCHSAATPAQQYVPVPNLTQALDSPEMTRIYVLSAGGATTTISDNGQQIGVLPEIMNLASTQMKVVASRSTSAGTRPAFLCWERPPGTATVTAETGSPALGRSITLRAEAGSVYYLMVPEEPRSAVKPLTEAAFGRYRGRMAPPEYLPGIMGTRVSAFPGTAPEAEAVPQAVPVGSSDTGF
jgi:hypothetical protein